jgi:hypothetical protein
LYGHDRPAAQNIRDDGPVAWVEMLDDDYWYAEVLWEPAQHVSKRGDPAR